MGLLDDLVSPSFPPKRYGQCCVTPRGEEVKSHAEKRIAEFFQRNGIPYVYEPLVESHFWVFRAEFKETIGVELPLKSQCCQ
jgi:hypothetical protein